MTFTTKITLPFLLIGLALATESFAQDANPKIIRCGQEHYENYLRAQDPQYDLKRAQMDAELQKIIEHAQQAKKKNGVTQSSNSFTIPVVFHVVYHTASQNVSDQQILYAVGQLNADWSRTNSDTANTPSVWKSIAANTQIQFCIATLDNSGNLTNGIVHKYTDTLSFIDDDKVKKTAQGGDDPWNTFKYLNIWVCNLGGGILGYGAYPPINSTYGTVVHYSTIGSLSHPFPGGGAYAYGRTLSHEIGHCFNLYHIWGNGSSGCSGNSDNVTDTPSMDGYTFGCPSGVQTSPGCAAGSDGSPASNVAPGRMYQNFMDYTDDLCYNMLTAGQKTRCQATINQYLTTIANNGAAACANPWGIAEKVSFDNISVYPNPSSGEVTLRRESSSVNPMNVNIYNAIGKTVLSKKISVPAKETTFDLSDRPDGIYLFEIKTADGEITRKVVLSR